MQIPQITQTGKKPLLTPSEKTAFSYHLLAELSIGVFWGINTILGELAKRTLGASDFQVVLLVQAIAPAMLLSVFWAAAMQRSKHVRKYLLVAGVFGRLPYALVFWLDSPNQLIALVYFCAIFQGIITPAMNGIFQANYRPQRRGILVGLAFSSGSIVMITTCKLVGYFLDLNEAYYAPIFVVGAVCAASSCLFLSLIPAQGLKPPRRTLFARAPSRNPIAAIGTTVRLVIKILKNDPQFAVFERNFFIYGSALWSSFVIAPIYLVQELNLSYSDISTAKALVGLSPALILPPLFGLLLDRVKPFRFSVIVMTPVAFFPLLLIAAQGQTGAFVLILVSVGYLVHGIGQTGVNLMWQLGSLHFAEPGEAYIYQGIHVSITGIRGILVPQLALLVKFLFGFKVLFVSCSALIAFAVLLMAMEIRRGRSRS